MDVRVRNVGDGAGKRTVPLTIDGTRVGEATFNLGPGEFGAKLLAFEVPTDVTGPAVTYTAGEQSGTAEVVGRGSLPGASLRVEEVSVTAEGQTVVADVEVGAEGFIPGGESLTGDVVVSVNGSDAARETVEVTSGSTPRVVARFPDQEPGEYEVCARVE
jgi:hypothetical protein